MSEFEAGILIGGKSQRFGQDKAGLKFGKSTLLERIYTVLKKEIESVWIVGNTHGMYHLPPDIFVDDIVPDTGPLGGLLTVLMKSRKPILLVSCDMPFIEQDHIKFLLDQFDPDLAGTIAVSKNGIEPLYGIYQQKMIVHIEDMIKKKTLALYRLFEHEKVKFVDFSKAGYISDLFFNINTLSDYKKALYLREEIESKKRLNSAGGKNG